MFYSIFFALFLLLFGIGAVFIVYMCLRWYVTTYHRPNVKSVVDKGLSPLELEKLPNITGKELVTVTECAVCLDEIKSEQPVPLVPGCNHAFHLQCADTWLSKNPVCPICRAKLDPQFFNSQSPC